jgi:hypothetical protein
MYHVGERLPLAASDPDFDKKFEKVSAMGLLGWCWLADRTGLTHGQAIGIQSDPLPICVYEHSPHLFLAATWCHGRLSDAACLIQHPSPMHTYLPPPKISIRRSNLISAADAPSLSPAHTHLNTALLPFSFGLHSIPCR